LFIRAEIWQLVGATHCQRPRDDPDEKDARTTPFRRAVMIRRVLEEGWSVHAVAASFEVSTHMLRKWLARFRREGRAGLENRS
jgi:transposase-like protein